MVLLTLFLEIKEIKEMYIGKKGITIAPLTYSGKVLTKDNKIVTKQHIVPAKIIGCRIYVFDKRKIPIAALDFDNGTVQASGYTYDDLEKSEYVMTYYIEGSGEYKSKDEISNKIKVYTCSENVELFRFLIGAYSQQFKLCRCTHNSAHDFIMYSTGLMAQIVGYLSTRFKNIKTVHGFSVIEYTGSIGVDSSFSIDVENLGFYCEIGYNTAIENNDMIIKIFGTRTLPSAVEVIITVKDILGIKNADVYKVVKRVCTYILATPDFVYTLSPLVLNPNKFNKSTVGVRGLPFTYSALGYSNTSHAGDVTILIDVKAR